jgi:hypothetical protein
MGANGNEFTIVENPGTAGEIFITSSTQDKDIIFKTNMGGTANTEVMRIVGTNGSLRMDTDQAIEFTDAAQYINSGGSNQLDIVANAINLSPSTGDVTVAVAGKLQAKTELTLYTVSGEVNQDEFRI